MATVESGFILNRAIKTVLEGSLCMETLVARQSVRPLSNEKFPQGCFFLGDQLALNDT